MNISTLRHATIHRVLFLAFSAVVFPIVSVLANQPSGKDGPHHSPFRLASDKRFSGTHVTLSDSAPTALGGDEPAQAAAGNQLESDFVEPSPVRMAPTRSSFMATWPKVPGATSYRLDVSTDPNFTSYVKSYHDLDAGRATFGIVSELQPDTIYYYRVRSFDAAGQSSYSETMSSATNSSAGLVITPTYDSSVNSSSKGPAIKAMVSNAIALYQTLFKDPITARILFRYATTAPDGTALPPGAISRSDSLLYSIPWHTYISALKTDASTQSDATANASLPTSVLSTNITVTSAAGRAIGLDTPPEPYPGGEVGGGLPFDGIVTFNSNYPLRFVRPPVKGNYDGLTALQHETDEVLGLGSHLIRNSPPESDLRPEDLFSWAVPLGRNTTTIGARYLSLDQGVTHVVELNQDPTGDAGDWLTPTCPVPRPLVQNAFGCLGGAADVSLSSPEATALDVIGYDLAPGALGPPSLANLSSRLRVESGDGGLIGGFIITGSAPKKVLLRAIGPSLPLSGTLTDPTLELHSVNALIASNNNWRTDQAAEIIATGIPPKNDKESAIVATLDPGAYTAIVQGSAGGSGIALVELYDLDQGSDSTFGNISTRGLVGNEDNVLIGGVIILGGESGRILTRALGPSLPVNGALADPTLELYDGNGTLIASNDNWRDAQQTDITAAGLPPRRDAESAILSTLPPGAYSTIVRGKNGTTGVALVEIYRLSD